MRRPLAFVLAIPAITLLLAGCGQQEPVSTPTACLAGPEQWLGTLAEVREGNEAAVEGTAKLGGETLISDCIPPDQPAGQQETVGRTAVLVASRLASSYRTDPATATRSALKAGYLAGAVERGAASSQGIHATLAERIRSAATNGLGQMSKPAKAAYKQGYEAGLKSG